MPNFVATALKNLKFPFGADGVEFLWSAKADDESLIYTKVGKKEFFLLVKDKKTEFVVKSDKLTRPASLGAIQKALSVYKDLNVLDLKSSAIAVKNEKQLAKKEFILNDTEFLEKLNSSKFKKIFVEIGFGSGRHLLYQAKTDENALVIGIEVYKPSCEQVNNLALSMGLQNVILLNLDARLVMSLLHSNSVDRLFLHFPVPWEKSEKRRVVSSEFANECQRVLKSGGSFELRSDDKNYTDFTISCFLNLKEAKMEIYKNRFLDVSSKYEDRWIRQNRDIYDVIFTNSIVSEQKVLYGDFEFGTVVEKDILSKFENKTIKKDDYFIHMERIYKKDSNKENGGLLLRVAFGSFYRPEHCFILVENSKASYFIKKPLLTYENLKAHSTLKEYLSCSTL
ncbi:tRNA (guanine-N7)-methyltransferase [Campylobacter fetus subsp. testudinum]|uniref:tRNA (guanosine(46)-N7)-methyltransferase TrmB n=1 Tax=Campylobacter fetus TaxID=196 RepID=UPI00057F7CD0|nr:tRNA (guanosine(46)-N7)-methyltransferase TrmB [Campylobacter fetus]AJB45782.1 tRNA (guanine-N7)-methyltransferase [Campylobacter fetus subsp. testudinum]